MRTPTIRTFYSPWMVPTQLTGSYSWSPSKPMLLLGHLEKLGLSGMLDVEVDFQPFTEPDFLIAHTPEYVSAFFRGEQPLCESNSIPWTWNFAQTVRYTNASLYQAIRAAVKTPAQVTFSPTSGFHHARPTEGMGFCTFSGQVIASVKLYRELGVRGAYLDLDGHFGNSIEDSRYFVPDLTEAIAYGHNINLIGRNYRYVENLVSHLAVLREQILAGQVDYLVWCHGADSHSQDDLGGGQCDTMPWVECSRTFFTWVRELDAERGKPLPVTISLFGGYRPDDYQSVLELHTADLAECAHSLLGVGTAHFPQVKDKFSYDPL